VSASHEPVYTKRGGFKLPGVLWIVLRPQGRGWSGRRPKGPSDSVQLGMGPDALIFGGWQGYPYVWEFEKNEAFRLATPRFGLTEAIATALDWAERELRPKT
jgi:hypothetical protein